MADWQPQGVTMHDRMMELVRRYFDSALQRATGMQGMMMRDAAMRMYPRIEATIRNMTEDELRQEINQVQEQVNKVLGKQAVDVKAKKPVKAKSKPIRNAQKQAQRGRKQAR